MKEHLEHVKPGDSIKAATLNAIIDELKRLRRLIDSELRDVTLTAPTTFYDTATGEQIK
jgi:hypothetical protein